MTAPSLGMKSARNTAIASILAIALGLVACSGDGAPRTRFLSLGTAPPGGAFFTVGGALAEVLQAHPPEAGAWEATAEATKGTQENIRRLISGELDLALANAAISYFAVRGEGAWDQEYPVRALMTLAPNVAMFVTPRSTGIERVEDLAGRRVVVGVAGAGFDFFVEPLLAAHGVSYDDFEPLYNTQTGAVEMLSDGSASAAFLGGAVPVASITQAATSQDVLLVPYSAAAKQQVMEQYPFFAPATIPADTYKGQTQAYEGLNVGSMHLIAAEALDDETAYQLTKAIYENSEEVIAMHPAGRAINAKNAPRSTGIPFHPGAERFYREIGVWPEAEGDPGAGDEAAAQ